MAKISSPDTLSMVRLGPAHPTNITSAGSHPFVLHTGVDNLTGTRAAETIATASTTAHDRSILVNVPNVYAYLDLWLVWQGTLTGAPDITIAGACVPQQSGTGRRLHPYDLSLGAATDSPRWWFTLEDGAGNASITMPTTNTVESGACSQSAPVTLHLRGAAQILPIVTSAATGTGGGFFCALMGRFYS